MDNDDFPDDETHQMSFQISIGSGELSGWGNFRPVHCFTHYPETSLDLQVNFLLIPSLRADSHQEQSLIPRGLGRSYGDSATNENRQVVDLTHRSQILEFDETSGRLRAEAGASLAQLISLIVPKGFFLPVTPGTQFVTLGGALAADVHGKNHHVDGGFSNFVDEIVLMLPDGRSIVCGPNQESEIFWATVGGMGLTGAIEEVTLRLLPIESAYIEVEATRTADLDETMEHLERTAERYRYSVSWIDALSSGKSLGRGWVLAGDHVQRSDLPPELAAEPFAQPLRRPLRVPFTLPSSVLSRWSCRLFNERVYRKGIVRGRIVDLEQFFYPLDRVRDWNRIYGRRGFVQYQALFPFSTARQGMRELLEEIQRSKVPAFFAGIKSAGAASPGLLSFLHPGFTIGIDLPYRRGLEELAARLDELVLRHGGRVYLAKDSLLSAEAFRRMYPNLPKFQEIKRALDPQGFVQSDQSRRLGITSP